MRRPIRLDRRPRVPDRAQRPEPHPHRRRPLDAFNLPRGYWEAKDEKDTLVHEMEKKFHAGYPHSNILFQRPSEALLYQDGRIAFHDSIKEPKSLVTVLHQFYEWRQPDHDSWDRAVREFSDRIPDIARGALKLIHDEHRTNRAFVERFAAFAQLSVYLLHRATHFFHPDRFLRREQEPRLLNTSMRDEWL